MGLGFGKKKKGQAADADAAGVSPESTAVADAGAQGPGDGGKAKKTGKAKAARKGKNDSMSGVLNETVVETCMECFAKNKNFIHGGRYVGLFFDTAAIGGLNRRASRNEDKGSIVENINSGRIRVLITGELMERECMVIVPDAQTIDAMDEYGILREVQYPLCYVSEEGDVEVKSVRITLEQAHDLLLRDQSVSMYLGDADEPEDAAGDDTSGESGFILDGNGDPPVAPVDSVPEDTPVADGSDGDMPFSADGEWEAGDGFDDDGWSGGGYGDTETPFDDGFDDEGSDSYGDDGGEEFGEITAEEFDKAMSRKLYSDDLGLVISTEAFDVQFMHTDSFVPFDTDRPDGWINNYLNQMSKDANTDMMRCHLDNLMQMRTTFLNLITNYCMDIEKDLDYRDEKTEYGKEFRFLSDSKAEAEDNVAERVSDRTLALNDEWERKLEEVGSSAASAAQQRYRDLHEKQHNESVRRIEQEVRADIEDGYADNVRLMHDKRREEAAKRFDIGVTAALSSVGDMYSELLEQEHDRYKEHMAAMVSFLDENRKDEIARTKALQEELRQSERAEAVIAEFSAKMQQQTAEFEARRKALADELEQSKRQSARDLSAKDTEYADKLRRAGETEATMQARIDDLIEQIGRIDEKKDAEYRIRIDELMGERDSYNQKYEHLVEMNRNSRNFYWLLLGVAVVAAAVIGFVGGEYKNIRARTMEAKKAVSESLKEDIADFELDLPEGYTGNVSGDGTVTIERESLPESE